MKNILISVLLLLSYFRLARAEEPACECSRCIAAYGDTRTNHDIHAKIAALIAARRPKAVFHTGDMVSEGTDSAAWEKFAEITRDLRAAASYYAVLGNHEVGGEKTFVGMFDYPGNERWYREDLYSIRFLMLDPLSPLKKGTEQFNWLDAQLSSPLGSNKFTAVVMHNPLMSSGAHGREKWKPAKDLEKLFKARGVDLILAGHDHNYERMEKDGIVHIVTGGGGAGLYSREFKNPYSKFFAKVNHYCLLSVCGDTLKLEAFDISDKLIDAVEIKAKPAAAPQSEKIKPEATPPAH